MCELAAFEEQTVPVLKRQHRALTKKIKKLQAVPAFNSLEMRGLKIEKANVKRKIAALGGKTTGMADEDIPSGRIQVEKICSTEDSMPAVSAVFMQTKRPSAVNDSELSVQVTAGISNL